MVFFAGKDIAPRKQGLTAPTPNSLEGGGIRRTEFYKRLRTLKMSHIGLFELYFAACGRDFTAFYLEYSLQDGRLYFTIDT